MQVPTADRELSPVAGQAHAGIAARPQVDTRSWADIGLCAATDVRLEPAVQLEPRPRAAAQILGAGKDDARRLVGNACLVVVRSRGTGRSSNLARPQFVHFKTVLYLSGNGYLGKSPRSGEHASDNGHDKLLFMHGYLLGLLGLISRASLPFCLSTKK